MIEQRTRLRGVDGSAIFNRSYTKVEFIENSLRVIERTLL
jgi:hypothetical protein